MAQPKRAPKDIAIRPANNEDYLHACVQTDPVADTWVTFCGLTGGNPDRRTPLSAAVKAQKPRCPTCLLFDSARNKVTRGEADL